MITAASAAAQKLGLKVSTSAILGQDLVHKAGQRHFGAAVGLTVFIVAYLNGKLYPG